MFEEVCKVSLGTNWEYKYCIMFIRVLRIIYFASLRLQWIENSVRVEESLSCKTKGPKICYF